MACITEQQRANWIVFQLKGYLILKRTYVLSVIFRIAEATV